MIRRTLVAVFLLTLVTSACDLLNPARPTPHEDTNLFGNLIPYEWDQLRDLVVVKKNARRENFDRDKLSRSIRIAMQKRPVEPERIEQMISGIVRRLESMGDTDIPSDTIGEIVMETLARIDSVAYVRFASVYKNFQEADDFEEFVAELRPPADPPSDSPSGD